MFERLRDELTQLIPDFGCYLDYDGKALKSHSTGQVSKKTGKMSDPEVTWCSHETKGVDKCRMGPVRLCPGSWQGPPGAFRTIGITHEKGIENVAAGTAAGKPKRGVSQPAWQSAHH